MSEGGDWLQVVEFTVGGDRFALPLDAVVEIVSTAPGTGAVRGYSGDARIVEGAFLLGVGNLTPPERRRGIAMREPNSRLVVLVDAVDGITTISRAAIAPPPERIGSVTPALVRGLVAGEDGITILLDPAAFIARAAGG
jgi:chemotaxis signal transduction protein